MSKKKGPGMRPDDLRAYRMAKGMTQIEFARWLSEALDKKYDHSRISGWERGAAKVPDHVERHIRMNPAIPSGKVGPALKGCFSNNKGGVGKTTCTTNVAAILAERGHPVLIVDCDAQANISVHLGIDINRMRFEKRTIEHLLTGESSIDHCIVDTYIPGLSIIPASLHLYSVEESIQRAFDRSATKALIEELIAAGGGIEERVTVIDERLDECEKAKDASLVGILRKAVEAVSERFDFILFDTPPGLGLVARNAMAASDLVIVPSRMERLSTMGVDVVVNEVRKMVVEHNADLEILGIVPTMYRAGLNQDSMTLKDVHGQYGTDVHVFNPIPLSVRYPESAAAGMALLPIMPRAPGHDTFTLIADTLIEERNRRLPIVADQHDDMDAVEHAE